MNYLRIARLQPLGLYKQTYNIIKFSSLNQIRLAKLPKSLVNIRTHASKSDHDEPVKFSTSKAKTWDSMDTFIPKGSRDVPRYQPFIVVFFLSVLMVYFVFLREENEIDEIMSRPLEDVVPNVKEQTLIASIRHYEKMGLDTRELKEALNIEIKKRELREAKAKAEPGPRK